MKIRRVSANNHKKAFEVHTYNKVLGFPFAKADPRPKQGDGIVELAIDAELGREGFRYRLESGSEGVVHMDQVLEYNADPHYLRELLLYNLTLEAQEQVAASPLSKREIIRRLHTSPAQFYRLVDQTNYRKSVDQMLALLQVLDCSVAFSVRKRSA